MVLNYSIVKIFSKISDRSFLIFLFQISDRVFGKKKQWCIYLLTLKTRILQKKNRLHGIYCYIRPSSSTVNTRLSLRGFNNNHRLFIQAFQYLVLISPLGWKLHICIVPIFVNAGKLTINHITWQFLSNVTCMSYTCKCVIILLINKTIHKLPKFHMCTHPYALHKFKCFEL